MILNRNLIINAACVVAGAGAALVGRHVAPRVASRIPWLNRGDDEPQVRDLPRRRRRSRDTAKARRAVIAAKAKRASRARANRRAKATP